MAVIDLISVTTVAYLSLLTVAYWVVWIIYCRTFHPLARVPGPLWPAVSRTWLRSSHFHNSVQLMSYLNTVYHMLRGDLEIAQNALHKRYGSLLRVAPNEVVSNDPSVIPLIYPTHNALPKTEWYVPFRPHGLSEHADLFTETDEQKHTQHRRIVQPAYQMSSILKSEAAMDECTTLFIEKLKELTAKKEDIDLGRWTELYTHDVLGCILFGRAFGFLESGGDIGSFIEAVDNAVPLMHVIAASPSYVRPFIMLAAMCIPRTLKRLKAIQATTEEAKRQTQLRMQRSTQENNSCHDILSQLLRVVPEKGSESGFTHRDVTLESWSGIMAGSDSTASNIRSVFYYLMKNPRCMALAVQEIKAQEPVLSIPVSYIESTKHLLYVGACIKEASRLFPSVGVSMSRVSPAQGIVLSGQHIPAGYNVGVNPHSVQFSIAAFGEDAAEFRPERWLESQARSFEMEKAMVMFGAGTRTCIGKNIALAEVYKFVPEVLRHFDMHMAHDRPWKTWNAGFVKQTDVIVRLAERV